MPLFRMPDHNTEPCERLDLLRLGLGQRRCCIFLTIEPLANGFMVNKHVRGNCVHARLLGRCSPGHLDIK